VSFPQKKISVDEAIIKVRTFCNYRDRCHKEVKDKLYGLGLWKNEVDQVMMQMMDEDLLNEERYARSFARGYFRTKRWGKIKIRYELQSKQIHSRLIQTALTEIDEDEYQQTIKHLIQKKLGLLKGEKSMSKKQKVVNYLMQKGYQFGDFKRELSEALNEKP